MEQDGIQIANIFEGVVASRMEVEWRLQTRFVSNNTSTKNTFYDRISLQLRGNRIKKNAVAFLKLSATILSRLSITTVVVLTL